MHRVVATCFKSIAFAIIFVIIWDVGFYLWRANALNQRMESIAVTMQEVVSKNNYLPKEDAKMFENILLDIQRDMNGDPSTSDDDFIVAFDWNYKDTSIYQSSNSFMKYQLNTPADYGDVQVIELRVKINATYWSKISGSGGSADSFVNDNTDIIFTYTYLVPCLKYTTVSS